MSQRKRQRRVHPTSSKQKGQGKNASSFVIPIVVGVMMVVIIVGVIGVNENQRSQSAAAGDASLPIVTAQPGATYTIPYPDVPRISLQETQDKLGTGQAVLVDVRSNASYEKAHAAGALSIPEQEIDAHMDELPRDKELVLYWTWGQEQQSARVAQKLMDQGFTNVSALLGGFAAWQRAGLAVEGSAP